MSGQSQNERNAISALTYLLRLAKVRVTALTVRERLEQHPDFPALSALSDTLTELNVPNLATKLPADRLMEMPLPALVQVRIGDDEVFAPVRQLTTDAVDWYDTGKGWQSESLADFKTHWTGIALLIETNEQSGEPQYAHNRRREVAQQVRVLLMLTGLAFCIGLLIYSVWTTATAPMLGLLLLKGLGTLVSGLLIAYSLDATNPALQKLCSFGKKTNCQSILQTSAAKIIGDFGWADVGLLYFAGGFVALAGTLLTQSTGTLGWLMVLTVLALPYTIWSVYYQAVVARQYCTLCLTVQALFWAELAIGYPVLTTNALTLGTLWPVLGTFVGISVLWAFVRKPLHEARQLYPLRRELQMVKFSEAYLHDVLANQPRQLPYLDGQQPIILGNEAAPNTLTLITNPACEGCRIVHQKLIALLEQMPDLRVEIVLVANTNPDDRAGQVAQHLLGLPASQIEKSLQHWFDNPQQSVTGWVRNVGAPPISEQTRQQLVINCHWHNKSGLRYTLVVFFNGVLLPPVYRLSDLPHLCRMRLDEPMAQLEMDSVESI